jgi:ferritin-like metal-binding protein YciE
MNMEYEVVCYIGLLTLCTKTGRHDIAEILLKVALSTNNQINQSFVYFMRMQQIENKQ